MRIAITGGIAEGKSTVLSYVREAGHSVMSADEITREIYHSKEIQNFLQNSLGTRDRAIVRARLVEDPQFRRRLNSMMHPAVMERIGASTATFFEVPLLIEAVLHPCFESVWVVTCGVAEQRRRLLERLQDPALADSVLATQLCSDVKIAFADRIVRTNLDEHSVKRYVLESITIDIP